MLRVNALDEHNDFSEMMIESVDGHFADSIEINLYCTSKNNGEFIRSTIHLVGARMLYSNVFCRPYFPSLTGVTINTNVELVRHGMAAGKYNVIELVLNGGSESMSFVYTDGFVYTTEQSMQKA